MATEEEIAQQIADSFGEDLCLDDYFMSKARPFAKRLADAERERDELMNKSAMDQFNSHQQGRDYERNNWLMQVNVASWTEVLAEIKELRAERGALQREVERLRDENKLADDALIKLSQETGMATGHGDTLADMVTEIGAQLIAALSRANANLERAWEHGWNAYAGIVQNRCPQEVFELMTCEKRRDLAALRKEK